MVSRNDMIRMVAEKAKISKKESKRLLDVYESCVYEALKTGEPVKAIEGFMFQIKEASPRTVRDLHTGEIVEIPAKKKIVFRPGKVAKEFIDDFNK